MIYCIHLGAFMQQTHTELPITHCLVGKRRDEFEKPSEELLKRTSTLYRGAPPFTQEEQMEVSAYRHEVTGGKYALKALAWVEAEHELDELKQRFNENEWDHASFVLLPVTVIPNGRP